MTHIINAFSFHGQDGYYCAITGNEINDFQGTYAMFSTDHDSIMQTWIDNGERNHACIATYPRSHKPRNIEFQPYELQ